MRNLLRSSRGQVTSTKLSLRLVIYTRKRSCRETRILPSSANYNLHTCIQQGRQDIILNLRLIQAEFALEGEGRVYQRIASISIPLCPWWRLGVERRGSKKGFGPLGTQRRAQSPAGGCEPEKAELSLQKWLRSTIRSV